MVREPRRGWWREGSCVSCVSVSLDLALPRCLSISSSIAPCVHHLVYACSRLGMVQALANFSHVMTSEGSVSA